MALVKCNECEKMISDSSKKCIECGAPINTESRKKNQIGWLILLIILLTVGLVVNKNFNTSSLETSVAEDEEEKSIHENRGSKNKMNEEAIRDAYRLFVNDGYTKGIEDFRTLMKSSEEGRKMAYDLFVTGGYSGGLSDFEELMGAKVASPVEKYSDRAADYFFHFFKVLSMKEIKEGVAYDINNNSLGSFSGEGGREGPWKCYYKDNKLAYEGYYEKGLMNGYFKHYYENGELFHEGAFLNGSQQNINERSGIPQSGRTGMHIFYRKNGSLESKALYTDGQVHGLRETWYPNGVKKEMAEFIEGIYCGVYQTWDESGTCVVKGRYNWSGKFESD